MTCEKTVYICGMMWFNFILAGNLKREKGSTEAQNERLRDKVKELQDHLQALRKSQEEQNKFHHATLQAKTELEVS